VSTLVDRGSARAGLRGAARGGLVNLAGAAFSGLAGLAVTMLVARGLGPDSAGVFFAATSVFLLAQMLAKLGTDTGLVYWVARLRATGRADLVRRCLRVALVPVVVAGIAGGVALFVATPGLAHLPALAGRAAGRHTADFARALRVLAVFLPAAALSDALLSATRGYRTMRPTVLVEKLARPALQLVLLAGALLFAGTTADTVAWVAPYLASFAVAAWWLARMDRPPTPAGHPVPRLPAGEFWRFTAPRSLSSICQVALQRLDVLLVAGMLGFRAAALYTVATRFMVVGQLGNQAIGTAVQPRLAELLSRHDTAGARTLYRDATAWLVLLTWPLYLGTAAFAPLYLGLFGGGYDAAAGVAAVPLLCAAMLAAAACGMVDMVLTMGGRTTWNLANVAVALGVNLALNLALIPPLGIVGAALAWAVALLVKNLLPLVQIGLVLRLHPFGPATGIAAALAVGCVGVPAAAARLVFGPTLLGLVAAVAVAAPAYAAACWLLRSRLDLLTRKREKTCEPTIP